MAKDYGERIPYDPLWRGPIEITRRKTDSGALNVFLVFLLIWFGIGIYAAFFLPIPNGNRHKRETDDEKIQLEELLNSKLKIFGCTVLAGFVALVYIFMLRRWAKFIVYTLIVLFWISLLALIVLELVAMQKMKDKTPSIYRVVVYSIVLVIFIILTLVYRREIAVTCEVIREATKTAMFFPSHFLMPIVVCVLVVAAFVYMVFIFARLVAHDEKKITAISGILHFYNLCAFLWVWNFISGTKHLIFSTSFSTWYWTMNKKYVPKNTVNLSVYKVGRYHLGTVALGSLIITVCQIIKALIKSIARETENSDGVVRCLMACFSCCCQSIMEFIQYVSRNAYIMTSIHGTDFFTSAKNAFNLIMRNVENVIVTTEIASLVLSMGILFSMLLPGAFCYLVVSKNEYVVTTAVLFSLILAASIFSILNSAVDTIFICVVEDYERNDGSQERPYYMSPKLRKILLKN